MLVKINKRLLSCLSRHPMKIFIGVLIVSLQKPLEMPTPTQQPTVITAIIAALETAVAAGSPLTKQEKARLQQFIDADGEPQPFHQQQ